MTLDRRLATAARALVLSEVIEPLGLSVTAAARALGVTRPALSALLNGRAALSSEMALRIEKAFGVSMDTLMRMRSSFEIARARRLQGRSSRPPPGPQRGTRRGRAGGGDGGHSRR